MFLISSIVTAIHPLVAYMDPGSGSLLLQLVLGGLAGAAVALKLFWSRIKEFFGRGDSSEKEEELAQTSESNPDVGLQG